MTRQPIVTIVIETGTREFTNKISVEQSVRGHLAEARNFSPDMSKAEVIYVGANLPPSSLLGKNCKCLTLPQTGYYGWKNAGFKAARGRYVVFWDSDCRPEKGYLRRVVDILEKDKKLYGATGVTRYDGVSFMSRLNNLLTFGYLFYDHGKDYFPFAPLTHNLVLRKSKYLVPPFGPYAGRVGGDDYVSTRASNAGEPLSFEPKLLMHHEDPSYSINGLLERHLREMFRRLLYSPKKSAWTALRLAFVESLRIPLSRFKRLFKFGKGVKFKAGDMILSIPVLTAYTALDTLAFLILVFYPPLLSKWLRFQFGENWDKIPVPLKPS
jgi:glycosyltransferase involved in cell wall biosynthesis